jgi:hypothetical protein
MIVCYCCLPTLRHFDLKIEVGGSLELGRDIFTLAQYGHYGAALVLVFDFVGLRKQGAKRLFD